MYQPFLTLQVDHHMDRSTLSNLQEEVREAEQKINESSQSLYHLGLNEDEKNKIELIEKQIFFLKSDFTKLYALMDSYVSEAHPHET